MEKRLVYGIQGEMLTAKNTRLNDFHNISSGFESRFDA